MFIFSAGLGTNISADAYYTVERLKVAFAATERYEVEGQNSCSRLQLFIGYHFVQLLTKKVSISNLYLLRLCSLL